MAPADPAAAARAAMPERYGRPSWWRRAGLLVAVALLVGGGLWWLVDAALEGSREEVAAGVAGFDVRSAGRTEVTLEVRRSVTTAAVCAVYAQAEDKAVVGERRVRLPARAPGTETVTVVIVTEREATTAAVTRCRATGG